MSHKTRELAGIVGTALWATCLGTLYALWKPSQAFLWGGLIIGLVVVIFSVVYNKKPGAKGQGSAE